MSAFTFNNGILTIRDCKYGSFAFYNSDSPIGSCLTTYGEWAEPELQFISPYLNEKSRVLDIGANIGNYTLELLKLTNAKVISFEPLPITFDKLKEKIREQKYYNRKKCKILSIRFYKKALKIRLISLESHAHSCVDLLPSLLF